MPSPTLPLPISGASPAPNTSAARAKPASDGGQFSAALSREVVQRQQQAAPQASPPTKPPPVKAAQPQTAAKPAEGEPARSASADGQDTAQPAAPASGATDPANASAAAAAAAAATDAAAADAAAAAAGTPALDMLALVASLNLPLASAPAAALPGAALPASPVATAAVPVAGPALPVAADQLTTPATPVAPLQDGTFSNMMGKLDGKVLDDVRPPDTDGGNPIGKLVERVAVDDAPAARATDTATLPKGQLDPAQLSALRTREAAPEAPALRELAVTAPTAAPVQQASLALAQAAAGLQQSDKIAARVGSSGWDQQVGQKIVWMVAGKEQSATLTLNPPDMGPMQVVLSVTNDQATVTFSAAQPEVRQALDDAMPKLREMMSESGIALGNASVNDGSAQQQAQADARASGRAGFGGGNDKDAAVETVVAPRTRRGGDHEGLVDTFA